MSSASRSEPLEALLAAKYELECCEEAEKPECTAQQEACIAAVLRDHPKISRGDLIEAIGPRYREYRVARLRAQRRRETL